MEAKTFLERFYQLTQDLYRQLSLASREALTIGTTEAYQKMEALDMQYSSIFNDIEMFRHAKFLHEQDLGDPLLQREIMYIYYGYLSHQGDIELLKEISHISTEIEQDFSTYRAKVEDKILTDNDVIDILENSTNNQELQDTWEANKALGDVIKDKVIHVVHLRNQLAQSLGFDNYHTMGLQLSEQDPKQIEALFDELDDLTRPTFLRLKNELDHKLADRFELPVGDLMPWHYQDRYFQEAPKIGTSFDLDSLYEDQNLENITTRFYKSINTPIEGILARSDLYEKEGKSQHAFCFDIDKSGDVRVLCNIKNNAKWMDTMLHEFGHAIYDTYKDPSLPFTLREPAHIFTTEAVAMFFGRLASNAQWIQDMLGIDDHKKEEIKDSAYKASQLRQLIFSRWVQVMYRFEKSMYANPDQDLQDLRWTLVEHYQGLRRPAGRENHADWATKLHIATAPCYYHNYMLGELLASQFGATLSERFFDGKSISECSLANHPEIGDYFKKEVFEKGASVSWDQLVIEATGRPLGSEAYAKQFCK